ncbi:hypothetical protein RHMOL_Rhmol04G0356600 [Rhododendron molle]|uniref:Uncharacterized protein n=1 Tax=Rhododendron molle TaxID=49168 RepID=A0ACC0P8V4_RHOML|nr:hypothetical protein RHMOL_Rhmol04G0356600 [Rhododendron molle]
MLDRCFEPRQLWKLKIFIRKGKLTLLCLTLTVIVIREHLGAGKFWTPQQDLNEQFYSTRRVRVLKAAESTATAAATTTAEYSYARVDMTEIWVGEDEHEEKPDPNKPYSLGPKSIKNKIDYCRVHGIEVFYNFALFDAEMTGFWAKLPLIRKLLLSHLEVEFFWWMDSDAMFTDMAFEVPWERYEDHNFVLNGRYHEVYDNKSWVGLNTGSFLLRNCQWSLDILDVWATMGPKGKIREEAGKLLTRELKYRPAFEADDQSALVYILATQRENWGDKVYLESAYCLHGFWDFFVDRYEEMIENYHPGLGDHRWPLVTHFVGCKPCEKFGDYPMERCFKQMDRAFNFGDNQILQMYGFTHKSLASKRVKRTGNETSNPLQAKDELGLLHPAFKALR